MRKFITKDKFITSFTPDMGTIVIDVNVQGVLTSRHQEVFRKEFPITYEKYIKLCMSSNIMPGGVLFFIEKGFDIALLVTQAKAVGIDKDTDEEIDMLTYEAVRELVNSVTIPTMLCSVVNRKHNKLFVNAIDTVGKGLDWYIYGS